MAKIKEVIKIIEDFAPLDLQADFDNSGLKIGNTETEITGVLVTLDTNISVINEAISHKCNLIIEHHPTIFKGLKSLNYNLPLIKAITLALKNDIAIYSAHTNIDFCKDGLNDYIAKKVGLTNIKTISDVDSPRIGELVNESDLLTFSHYLETIFNDKNISTIGDLNKKIKKVAIVNGGGGSNEDDLLSAFNFGADVFVTGDVKYNVARLAKDAGYAIIQVGHYNTEQYFLPLMEDIIGSKIKKIDLYQAKSLLNPYNQ